VDETDAREVARAATVGANRGRQYAGVGVSAGSTPDGAGLPLVGALSQEGDAA